jgi:hypothetical protein
MINIFEEDMLAVLLQKEILFCNQRYYSQNRDGKSEGETIVLFVICNDSFCYAADAEDLPLDEIPNLYKLVMEHGDWGALKWCALKRNEKPLSRVVEKMKQMGIWDAQMDDLAPNFMEGRIAKSEI